jgi:hypothetical protein
MTQPNFLALPELEQRTLLVEEIWPSDDGPRFYLYRADFAGDRWVCPEPPKPWASKEVAPGDAVLNREPTVAELDEAHDNDQGLFLRWWWADEVGSGADRLRRLATTPPDPSAKAYAALPDDAAKPGELPEGADADYRGWRFLKWQDSLDRGAELWMTYREHLVAACRDRDTEREEVERLSGWLMDALDSIKALVPSYGDYAPIAAWRWHEDRAAAQEQRRNDLRRSALAKLSAEEAEALGVDWKGVGKAGDDG